ELELGKGRDGTALVLDVRRFDADGPESRYLRRICLPRKEDLDLLNRLKAPTPGDIAASYRECWQLTDLGLEGKFDDALKFFDANRAAFRKDRAAHQSHLGIARKAGPEAFAGAVAEFEQDFPQDSLLN